MKITFSQHKPIEASPTETLLSAMRRAGLPIAADCAGNGRCGSCRVRLVSGALSAASPEEKALLSLGELATGVRLACCAMPLSDCEIALPRAAGAAKGALRFPPDFAPDGGRGLGLAFDIGTTTVAGMLCDLYTGRVIAAASRANPQGRFGADVISRIDHCGESLSRVRELQSAITGCLREITGELCESAGADRRDIARATAAGNTTMTHIFAGESPAPLARAPFAPVFLEHEDISADALDIAPGACIAILPNIAGHVGADMTAAMLSSRIAAPSGPSMLIDIGTNGEMAFFCKGRLAVCSTAAGPAFEGACISHGMRAEAGAVSAVRLGASFELETVENAAPRGVCGSGLIDAVALLLEHNVIDATGRVLSQEAAMKKGAPEALACRIKPNGRVFDFELAEGVVLTQRDVREVQLAKAAIAAGMNIVMRELSLSADMLESVMVAGAFGSFIRRESAIRIGLLPPVPPERVVQLGNAAGAGACMALMSEKERERARALAKSAEHIELATHKDFQGEFIKEMRFPTNEVNS